MEADKNQVDQAKLVSELRAIREQLERLEHKVDTLAGKEPPPETRLLTHVHGLDQALGGGIPAGHVVLMAGPSGTMKTSLALYIVQKNRAQGVKGLYFTLEESRESLVKTMMRLDIGSEEDFIVDIGKLRLEHEAAEETHDWLQILRDYLTRRLEKGKLDIVVVDSLNSLYSLADLKDPKKELFRFFSFLRGIGVTGIMIFEADSCEPMFKNQEDYLADAVFIISFSESDGKRQGLLLRCPKMRHSEHSRSEFELIYGKGEFAVRNDKE